MLLKLVKPAFLGLAALLGGWLSVVAYWRLSARDPGAVEIVGLLILVPLAILGLWYLLLRGLEALSATRSGAAETDASETSATEEPPRHRLSLLSWQLSLPIGADCEEALSELQSGTVRPGLDESLKDDHGFPVFAARCPGLPADVRASAAQLAIPEHPDKQAGVDWSEDQYRALALGSSVFTDMLDGFISQSLNDRRLAPCSFHLALVLPREWSQAERLHTREAFTQRLAETLDAGIFTLTSSLLSNQPPVSPLSFIDTLSRKLLEKPDHCLCLLLAMDSAISEPRVLDMGTRNLLFHQGNPRGRIPAEGAAGLLVASNELARVLEPVPCLELQPAWLAAKPAESGSVKNADISPLARMIEQSVAGSERAPDKVALAVTDAGLQPGLAVEGAMAITRELPHLDAGRQTLHLGTACGDLGAAAWLASLVLAATACAQEDAPVVLLGLKSTAERSAVMLAPAAPVEDESPEPENEQTEAQPAAEAALA